MRLSLDQVQAIKQTVYAVLGAQSRVILFGSRVDDAKKGGDIDLLFEVDHQPASQRRRFYCCSQTAQRLGA